MPTRLYSWLFPPKIAEKETIVKKIENENNRLTEALDHLSDEVKAVKKDRKKRDEITHLFDDALEAINKQYRK